jgi:hypothetical protein
MTGKASAPAAPRGKATTAATPRSTAADAPTKTPDESTIRDRAYALWEQAGYPEGDGVEFWLRAERELTNGR